MHQEKYLIMHKGKPFRVETEEEVINLLRLLSKDLSELGHKEFIERTEIYILVGQAWHDCKTNFL